jgi:hypothetical protein
METPSDTTTWSAIGMVVAAVLGGFEWQRRRGRDTKVGQREDAADDVNIASSRAEVRGLEVVERQRDKVIEENEKLRAALDVVTTRNTDLSIKSASADSKLAFARRVARQAMKDLRRSNPDKAEELQTNFASFFNELDEPKKDGA